tara:strand:- start:461 stop:700 length:240 start_codon:yes stop_codon:yes gene_type:complete
LIELRKIEEIVENVAKVIPVGTEKLRDEIRENVRVILESSFERMNLVTREEFDAQTVLLRRTRKKLDELEAIVATLEPE